jgi:hypothetical protein
MVLKNLEVSLANSYYDSTGTIGCTRATKRASEFGRVSSLEPQKTQE